MLIMEYLFAEPGYDPQRLSDSGSKERLYKNENTIEQWLWYLSNDIKYKISIQKLYKSN